MELRYISSRPFKTFMIAFLVSSPVLAIMKCLDESLRIPDVPRCRGGLLPYGEVPNAKLLFVANHQHAVATHIEPERPQTFGGYRRKDAFRLPF